jgi:hypothetical protein
MADPIDVSRTTLWHTFSVRNADVMTAWLGAIGFTEHATYRDEPHLPHVIIAEARKSKRQPDRLRRLRDLIRTDFLEHLDD